MDGLPGKRGPVGEPGRPGTFGLQGRRVGSEVIYLFGLSRQNVLYRIVSFILAVLFMICIPSS